MTPRAVRRQSAEMTYQVSQNFHPECEAAVNQLVNLELCASYVCVSMANHFDRDDVALSHAVQFFREQFQEDREHAKKFLRYQNKLHCTEGYQNKLHCTEGGSIVLKNFKKPD
ncbi:UNVERIFIED_CONTAM: hypothetical protein K2H54_057369 [Gekko kuhli]